MGDFFDDRLEPFFKLSLVFGPGNEGAHVQGVQGFVFQVFGHIAFDDAVGQPLGNGCFSRSWGAHQNGVVFGAPTQDLQDPTNFLIPPNHGVELVLAGKGIEVFGVFLKRLIGVFGRGRGNFFSLLQLVDGAFQRVLGGPAVAQQLCCRSFAFQNPHEQVLGGHELIALLLGELPRLLKALRRRGGQAWGSTLYCCLSLEFALQRSDNAL